MGDIKYPEGKYKIITAGPSETFSFKGNDGDVELTSYSLQFEGVSEWIKLTQKPETVAPVVGEELEGHIEDTGKYGLKFVKKRGSGGWGGGKKDYTGAKFNAAASTATQLVIGYYQLNDTKPKNINELLEKVSELTPKMKAMVDKLAGAEGKSDSEEITKESLGVGNPDDKVVIDDVDEKELSW